MPAYLDWLAIGMGLALAVLWLERRRSPPAALRVIDRFPGLSWVAAAVAFWVLATRLGLGRM